MSLTLCSALLGLSVAWVSTKASQFGGFVANKQWEELDSQFFRTAAQSLLVLLACAGFAYGALLFLNSTNHPFAKRFVSPLPFSFLLAATAMNHVVFCEAQYLRTHKSEPFLYLSIANAALTCGAIYLLARPFGALGVSAGYLVCCVVSVVWGTIIFVNRRREWHI